MEDTHLGQRGWHEEVEDWSFQDYFLTESPLHLPQQLVKFLVPAWHTALRACSPGGSFEAWVLKEGKGKPAEAPIL